MHDNRLAFLIFGFCTLLPQAQADFGLSLNVSNVNLVWSTSLPTQQLTFTVNKSKNSECDYAITFSKGSASDYSSRQMTSGAATLRYQLYKESSLTNILKDYPDYTNND